jgi:hypothetical protein
MPSVPEWESIERQRRKLQEEEEEAMAKILRLRKQQRLLDDREKEMIRRGLASLDDLDAAEEKDRELAEAQQFLPPSAPSEPSSSTPFDPSLAEQLLDFDPSSSYWADLGSVDGTAQANQGS